MSRQRSGGNRPAGLVVLLAAATLVAVDVARGNAMDATTGAGASAPSGAVAAATLAPPLLHDGPGIFDGAGGIGPILGVAATGPIMRFQVAVERGIAITPGAFASDVERILSDSRSWIADRQLRLQRVALGTKAQFTIYLATPATSAQMCQVEWLDTQQYTSCRLSTGKVVINLARWLTAVPDYGAPLDVYQAYAVNHEVGHQLGHGHEDCPGAGQLAPVMQQQTLGLQGCRANPWPYLDGVRYRGPSVAR